MTNGCWFLLIGLGSFLGMYWGKYYGGVIWRTCRYIRLILYRKCIQRRKRFNSIIDLGR